MQENSGQTQEKQGSNSKKLIIIILSIVGALVVAYLILCQAVQSDSIWTNASVNGVVLKDMTYEEAETAVNNKFAEDYGDAAVTVELDGKQFKISVYHLLDFDASSEIDKIYKIGHSSWIESGLQWLELKLTGGNSEDIEVVPTLKEDSDAELLEAIKSSGILDYNSLTETTWDATDTSLVIHKGKAGVTADEEQLKEAVKQAIEDCNFGETIECPSVTTDIQAVDFEAIAADINREASNATLDPNNGYAVVDSVTGRSLNVDTASAQYEAADEGTDVTVSIDVTEPTITTAMLEQNLFADVLGSYSSTVTGSSAKMTNISLAVQACNGTILMPGEEFSYNGHVGETTEARGFQTAAVYKDGKVEYETGGGVCQGSSTIFAALLYTDLEVVQRQCHSMIVTYVPYGMDATVYWTQPDFRFKNNHNYPVKLQMDFSNSVITVTIIGTKESGFTISPRVEQTGELQFVTYRDYYDASGNLVESEYIGASKYKQVSS